MLTEMEGALRFDMLPNARAWLELACRKARAGEDFGEELWRALASCDGAVAAEYLRRARDLLAK